MATAIASRYARALADVVSRSGEYRSALDELADFSAVYRTSGELRDIFRTPAIPLEDKTKVLEAILARLGTSPMVSNFFHVLLANYRLPAVEEIAQAFEKIAMERLGIARVGIRSALTLSETERRTLVTRFASVTRKRVEADFEVDPKLLGGVTAQIGSTVYDGSVRGHLERLRERLTAR